MLRIEDPLLTLILRFVLADDHLEKQDEEFIQRQIQTMQDYVKQFPKAEHESITFKWIEQHAAAYRRNWEKKVVCMRSSEIQCADCPLIIGDGATHCQVHNQWLELLNAYSNDNIDTRDYVVHTLSLLEEHKDQLRIAHNRTA